MKSIYSLVILCSMLCCRAEVGFCQDPAAPTRKLPTGAEQVPEPKAAEPKAPEPKTALSPLEEMVRGQRDDRWRRERGNLRRSLEEAGFVDKAVQDAVVDFAEQQDVAREELRAVAARCSEAVRNTELPEAELLRLLESYQAEALKAQDAREAALAKLDEKVRWKKQPRLEILLRLKGLLGNQAWLAGDALAEPDSFDLRILYPAVQ
jgi:hypothetical protein